MRLSEADSSGEAGHRYRRAAAGQAPAERAAAFRRREGADRAGAADRDLPLPAKPLLHPGRSGRAARRNQRRPLRADGGGDERGRAIHRGHAQPPHDGNGLGALRRDHAGAGRLQACFRELGPGTRRGGQQRRLTVTPAEDSQLARDFYPFIAARM